MIQWPDEPGRIAGVHTRLINILCNNRTRPYNNMIAYTYGENRSICANRNMIPD